MRTSSSAPRASTCWPPAAPLTRSRSPAAPRCFFVVETLGAATPHDPPRLRPLPRPLPSAVPVPPSVSKQPVRVASIRRPRPGPQGAAAPPPDCAGPAPPLVAAPASAPPPVGGVHLQPTSDGGQATTTKQWMLPTWMTN